MMHALYIFWSALFRVAIKVLRRVAMIDRQNDVFPGEVPKWIEGAM
jgi:hypothetical protein